jgi:hypothetical protein
MAGIYEPQANTGDLEAQQCKKCCHVFTDGYGAPTSEGPPSPSAKINALYGLTP